MFANTVMFSACKDFSVLSDTGLPTHKPLSLQLSLDAFQRRALRPQRPLAFPTAVGSPPDPEAAWRPGAHSWTAALNRTGGPDLDVMWDIFCKAAKNYLLTQLSGNLDCPPQRYLGRASC